MENLLQALAVTAEVLGADLSPGAAKVIASDLSEYPEDAVIKALKRCRRECRGRLSLADILERIDDGRPGGDEAWGMYPKDEESSAVVTNEMQLAMRNAWSLVQQGDMVAARVAFKETYTKIVADARAEGRPPRWEATLGEDRSGRESALVEAVEKERLSADHAMRLLPPESHAQVLRAAGCTDHPALASPTEAQAANQRKLKAMIASVSQPE